jgi:hypothetical protein
MSGPFSWCELKKEARGEVIVSPLGAVDKAGEPGKLRIIRDLSFKGKAPFSVNDKIDPNSYLTKWSTAAMIIDLVSLFLFMYLFIYSFFRFHICRTSCISKSSFCRPMFFRFHIRRTSCIGKSSFCRPVVLPF